jgi:hypothetical protein
MLIEFNSIKTNHITLYTITSLILFFFGNLKAQPVDCEFFMTPTSGSTITIGFRLPNPFGGPQTDQTIISGQIAGVGGGSSGVKYGLGSSSPVALYFDNVGTECLFVNVSSGNPPDPTCSISGKTIQYNDNNPAPADPPPPVYNFMITITHNPKVNSQEDWEIRIRDLPALVQKEITLTITSTDGGAARPTNLTVYPAPVVNIVGSPLTIDETIVGESRTGVLTIENTASGANAADLVVTSSTFTTTNFSSTSTPSITPGSSGSFDVEFAPPITSSLGRLLLLLLPH